MLIAFTSLHRSTVPHESKWLVHVKTRTVCFHNYSDLPITHILSMTHPLKTIGVSFFWILFNKNPIYLIEFLEYFVFLKSSSAGIICYYSEVCWRGYTWWLIPLSKWVITPVIGGLTLLIPCITGVITHLLSGMSHQVPLRHPSFLSHVPARSRRRILGIFMDIANHRKLYPLVI